MEEVENSSKRKAAKLDSEDNSTVAVPDGHQPLPGMAAKRLNLARSCIHEVAVPNGYDLAKDGQDVPISA
jgi:ATP-dependent RNA helicase DOB1